MTKAIDEDQGLWTYAATMILVPIIIIALIVRRNFYQALGLGVGYALYFIYLLAQTRLDIMQSGPL